MDFPVECTLHLRLFSNESEVRDLLRSHGLVTSDLGQGRLQVRGSFLRLRAVKLRLETRTSSSSWSSPGPAPSQALVVDSDAFRYAQRLRKREVDVIMRRHEVTEEVTEVGGNTDIRLVGRGAESAAAHLQSLLIGLSQSLRTQEVPLKDMGPEGIALLQRVRQKELVHGSVLVRQVQDGLHLVGPSAESYELQQLLLRRTGDQSGRTGRTGDQSGRTGRTIHRDRGGGGSSLPPIDRSHRNSGAFTDPRPAGAAASSSAGGAGSSSSGGAGSSSWQPVEPRGAAAAPWRRSSSEPRQKVNDVQTGRETGNGKMTSLKRNLMSFSPKSVNQKLRSLRQKK